jgi:hypothetical protein
MSVLKPCRQRHGIWPKPGDLEKSIDRLPRHIEKRTEWRVTM